MQYIFSKKSSAARKRIARFLKCRQQIKTRYKFEIYTPAVFGLARSFLLTAKSIQNKKGRKIEILLPFRVTSGVRTHDIQNHNLTL